MGSMRRLFLTLLLSSCASAPAGKPPMKATEATGENIPAPDFNRVDYDHPDRYLAIEPTLGSAANIRKIASGLPGKTPKEKLTSIRQWMTTNLRDTGNPRRQWRTFDEIVNDGSTNSSSSEAALVYGALARAAGIPVVWVKTMDIAWIREFVRNPNQATTFRGYTFLEVFLDGKWRLLDASSSMFYEDYSPRARILPGNHWAYDKGGDPFTLILPSRGDVWNRQVAAHFGGFEVSQLPVGNGKSLADELFAAQIATQRTVHIVADAPVWGWVGDRMRVLGMQGRIWAFNMDYPKHLKAARGNWLILTAIGDSMTLPLEYRGEYSPASAEQIRQLLAQRASGRFDRHLDDGTIVILVCGRDLAALHEEIDHLTLTSEAK